jgi:hypothetical protein
MMRAYFSSIVETLTLLLVFFVMGCTKVSLEAAPEETPEPTPPPIFEPDKISGKVCADKKVSSSSSLKVMFLIDMSVSNIYTDYEYDNVTSVMTVDFSSGTDFNGIRIDWVENFIENCGESHKYQIVGFRESVEGSCARDFVSKSSALSQIETLRSHQQHDIDLIGPDGEWNLLNSPPLKLGKTGYYNALNCMKEAINHEIVSDPDNSDQVLVYFLSDGKPDEEDCLLDDSSSTDAQCYRSHLESWRDTLSANRIFVSLQPIFYGDLDSQGPNAREILETMAEVGGVEEIIEVTTQQSFNLCEVATRPEVASYTIGNLQVVNLTTRLSQGLLLPDSDMDGLVDVEEVARGYDPTKRVSKGFILDVAHIQWGFSGSPEEGCEDGPKGLLNTCDLRFFNMNGDEWDQDTDNMIDFLEVLSGMNPQTFDANEDHDNDMKTALEELKLGTHPKEPDAEVDSGFLIDNDFTVNTLETYDSTCPQGNQSGSFEVQHLPLLEVEAYDEHPLPFGPFDLRHEKNVNVILLLFTSIPIDPSQPAQLRARVVKVNTEGKIVEDLYPNFATLGGEL